MRRRRDARVRTMATDDEPPTQPSAHDSRTAYEGAAAFRPAKMEPLLVRGVAGTSKRCRVIGAASARRDLVAGLTVAALALPSAMAYGQLAGLSPVNGLYALLLPTVAYVLLGSSRAARDRSGGSVVDAGRRGGPPTRRRRAAPMPSSSPRCSRCSSQPASYSRAAAAARLARGLLLPAGAGRLPPRYRGRRW